MRHMQENTTWQRMTEHLPTPRTLVEQARTSAGARLQVVNRYLPVIEPYLAHLLLRHKQARSPASAAEQAKTITRRHVVKHIFEQLSEDHDYRHICFRLRLVEWVHEGLWESQKPALNMEPDIPAWNAAFSGTIAQFAEERMRRAYPRHYSLLAAAESYGEKNAALKARLMADGHSWPSDAMFRQEKSQAYDRFGQLLLEEVQNSLVDSTRESEWAEFQRLGLVSIAAKSKTLQDYFAGLIPSD